MFHDERHANTSPLLLCKHAWLAEPDSTRCVDAAEFVTLLEQQKTALRKQAIRGPQDVMMDETGLDVQVLSLTTPGLQNLEADISVDLARRTNDLIAETVARRPDRFEGFAALPTPAPDHAEADVHAVAGYLRAPVNARHASAVIRRGALLVSGS